MRIAIASGKGGTGKTTIAVNLAASLNAPVAYADCDVEEPNGHLFLKPVVEHSRAVSVPVPAVDHAKCTGCGRCAEVCRYHAIACIKGRVLVFPEMCHGCGGCALACPVHAILEMEHGIGRVDSGHANGVAFIGGILKVGTAMSPPLIRAVKQDMPRDGVTILDAPPGTSCPMIAAVRDSDFVLLVTEPTPFGLHDLRLAVDTIRQIGLPFGVVINRCDVGDARVHEYCAHEGIPVLLEIPDSRRIAELYSRGEIIVAAMPEMKDRFLDLFARVQHLAKTDAPHRSAP